MNIACGKGRGTACLLCHLDKWCELAVKPDPWWKLLWRRLVGERIDPRRMRGTLRV
jgi:hypothetical protein